MSEELKVKITPDPLSIGQVGECRIIWTNGDEFGVPATVGGWRPLTDLARYGWEPLFMTQLESGERWGHMVIKRVRWE